MNQTYIINQEFTFLEYLNITYFQTFRMKIIKRMFIFFTILGILNVVLNFALIPTKNIVWYIVVRQLLLMPVFLFVFLIVSCALITFLIMKLKPKLFTNTKVTLTHWGMEKIGETINYSAPWGKFIKYKETKKYFLFYVSDMESHVIQKRWFEDNSSLEAFEKFISEKIGRN